MLGVGGSADDRRAAASAGCDQAPATKHASARESGQDLGVSQPLRLLVETRLHSEDLARFETNVVRGPHRDDCAIWVGAIGGWLRPELSGAKPCCPGLEAEYGKGEVVCVGRTVCGMGAALAPSVSGAVPYALRFWFRLHERVDAPPHFWGVGIHGEVTALGDLGEFDAVLL